MEGVQVALLSCLFWLPIAVAVWALIGGMIMGDVDPLVGLLGIGMSVGVGIWVIKHHDHPQIWLLLAAVWLGMAMAPTLMVATRKAQIYQLEVDQVQRAYEQLQLRSTVGPTLKIASIIVRRGLPEHAIGMAEKALEPLPKRMAASDLRQVAQWKAVYDPRPDVRIPCAECGTPNAPGDAFCSRCRAPYLLLWMKGRRISAKWTRRLTAIWIASAAMLAVVPMADSMLAPNHATLAVIGILGTGILLILLSFLPPREKA